MSRTRTWPRMVALVFGAIIFLFPFYYMVIGSLQAKRDTSIGGVIPTHGVTLHNYVQINGSLDLVQSLSLIHI